MKKIKKMFFKNFDAIYKSCKKVSKEYGIKHCSIVYLKKCIDIVKENKVDKSEVVAHKIQLGYFDVLDAIYNTCNIQAKKIGSDGVSFAFLKAVIAVVKKSYSERQAA